MLNRLKAVWDIIAAVFFTVCIAVWAKPDIWDSVSSELITFFGIQAAAVLPAMIFTAGFLKSDGITLNEVRKYRDALRSQMVIWAVVLGLDFSAALSVIIGKAFGWEVIFVVPVTWTWLTDIVGNQINFSIVFACITAFLSSLAVMRLIPIVNGIMSLLELHGKITESTIIAQNTDKASEKFKSSGTPFKNPEGYGKISKTH